MVSFFFKSWSVGSRLRWLFALAYSSHLLWSWPLGRTWYHHTSLSSIPLSQGLPILPDSFLRKVIIEPALPEVFDCPPAWSCPQVFNSGLGMRLCEGRFDKELLSCRFFLEFQSYSRHRNHFDIDSKQTHSEEIQVIPMERFSEVMNLLSWFWWKYEVTFGWSKWFKIQYESFNEPVFKAFILFVWIIELGSHEKASPTDPDCLPLIRKGLILARNVGLGYWLWRKRYLQAQKVFKGFQD